MAQINLRDYYPWYQQDTYIEIPDEVDGIIKDFDRLEGAYLRRLYRYKAHYSLDRDDGIENDIAKITANPFEEYEDKLSKHKLYTAIASLPDKQAKRIYAHFFLGMSKTEIARAESISERTVRESIESGFKNLKKFLKKTLEFVLKMSWLLEGCFSLT